MNVKEQKLFRVFKKQIITTFLKENSGASDVKKWTGDTIIAFQDDLLAKVNARVSEKWFYNYFKNEPTKLPRIDMLNILSNYIGYKNWEDFKKVNHKRNSENFYWILPVLIVLFIVLFLKNKENTFHFCFYDEDKKEPITSVIDIKILKTNESPLLFKSDENGCFEYHTKDDFVELIISSSYYKKDTIKRFLNGKNNIVNLATDDYALMLEYYANNDIKNWKKRKQELEKLIDDTAIIYQLYSKNIGVEIYDKEEFINLLTIPTSSLKKIKILNKEFKKGKIVKLKFIIK